MNLIALLAALVLAVPPTQQTDVALTTNKPTVQVGDTFHVVATAIGIGESVQLGGADLVLTWDPVVLRLEGAVAHNPDGLWMWALFLDDRNLDRINDHHAKDDHLGWAFGQCAWTMLAAGKPKPDPRCALVIADCKLNPRAECRELTDACIDYPVARGGLGLTLVTFEFRVINDAPYAIVSLTGPHGNVVDNHTEIYYAHVGGWGTLRDVQNLVVTCLSGDRSGPLVGDLDHDGDVDLADFAEFQNAFGRTE